MLHFPLHRWYAAATQRSRIADWTEAGHLTPAARRVLNARAQAASASPSSPPISDPFTDPWPTAPDWRAALNLGLLWLGALLTGIGVIMFIAANWERVGPLLKIGGVELLILACALAALLLRKRPPARNAALLVGALATGGLLALVGQTYQTGADTAVLFGYWSLTMLPWVLAATTPVLGMLWATVLSFALWLAFDQYTVPAFIPRGFDVSLALAALNLLLLAAWEAASTRVAWMNQRVAPRYLAALGISALSYAAINTVGSSWYTDHFMPGFTVWALAVAALVVCYYRIRQDLMMLAMVALSVLVVLTWAGGSYMFKEDFLFGLFGAALLAIAQAAVYTGVLHKIGKRWQS